MSKIISIILALILSCFYMTAANNDEVIADSGQAGAYIAVFEYLYELDSALNHDIKYIAFDLTGVLLEDPDALIELLERYCKQLDKTFLNDTVDGLIEKGLVKDLYFEKGILISFSDIELTDDRLTTSAMKWRSGIGAIGATCAAEKIDDIWEIIETGGVWIS